MGAGAMLGKLRSPRLVQLTPRGRQSDDGTPVVGRACEDADSGGGCRRRSWHCRIPTRQVAESGANGEAGTAHVRCTKCSFTRAVPYGTVAFTCQTCGSDVRVSLSTMSAHAKADVRARLVKAEHVVRSALEDQVTSCRQLCDGLKKCLSEEDATWQSQPPDSEAARARTLVRAAVGSHDWSHAEETLRHWTSLGHPLLSEKFEAALISLKEEDELEVLWRRALSALTAVDSTELEYWCNEAVAKSVQVPTEVKDVIEALRGQERAMRTEEEYQAKLKARVTEARVLEDIAGLKALAMEAKLLGEDSSVVDAVIGPVKSYRRKRSESLDNHTSASVPRTSSIRYIKEELAKRGISCAGVIEKDELQSLLTRGRYSPGTEASDGSHSEGPGAAAPCRVPCAPPSPKAIPSNAAGPAGNPKPPLGPRPRTARYNQAPPMAPGMPGGSEGTVPPRASRATFASAWAQLWAGASSSGEAAECVPGGSSYSSKPPAACTKTQSSDDSTCDNASGAHRPVRPSSASAKPYANWSNFPNLEGHTVETSTPRRRPSSASARDSPGQSEPAAARRTPVPSGSASARGTSAPRNCESSAYRRSRSFSASASAGAQSHVDFSCGGDAAAASSGSSSATLGGMTVPSAHGLPPVNSANRQPQAEASAASVKRTPSASSASARPPQADARNCDSALSPRRGPPTFRPASYADGVGGETSAPHRRPSSASMRGRGASCDDGLGVDFSAPQRKPSLASMAGASISNPSEFIFGIPTPIRPSSASAASQSYAEGPATPQRPARPSSASRATSSREAASPRQQPARPPSASRTTGSQDAASPRRGMASSPWARTFTTPSEVDRRPSKRNSSMPPRPPCQSPRPERTSAGPPSEKGFSLPPARSSTPTREAALTCLGLKGSPTGEEIRRAYKQAALQCHPDRPQNHAIAEEAKANFQQVKAAFDLLQVPERRTTAAAGG